MTCPYCQSSEIWTSTEGDVVCGSCHRWLDTASAQLLMAILARFDLVMKDAVERRAAQVLTAAEDE